MRMSKMDNNFTENDKARLQAMTARTKKILLEIEGIKSNANRLEYLIERPSTVVSDFREDMAMMKEEIQKLHKENKIKDQEINILVQKIASVDKKASLLTFIKSKIPFRSDV